MMLLQAEKEMIQELDRIRFQLNNATKTSKLITRYLNIVDYDL